MNTRTLATSVLLAIPALLLVGCSTGLSSTPPTEAPVPDVPGGASAGAGTAATSLPDSVPLPRDAQLAEASKSFTSDHARGWTAVALTPAGTGLSAVAGDLSQSLQTVGWATKVTGDQQDGFVIASTRRAGADAAWLNINVTTPVPGAGPAVTYRYAVATADITKPSKSVTQ